MATVTMNKFTIEFDPDFGDWLRRAREAKGFTLTSFARAIDMHSDSYRSFERGEPAAYYLGSFIRIAKGLDIELGYLLHKAGFDIGRDGINTARLKRAESVTDAIEHITGTLRAALSEAVTLVTNGMNPTSADAQTKALADIGVALALLDAAEGRLRADSWITEQPRSDVDQAPTARRPWTEADEHTIMMHPTKTNSELAHMLGRTVDAVRFRRQRLTGTKETT